MSEAAVGASGGVDDLDPTTLLAVLADNERVRRRADLLQLRLAYQWCVLHPATTETGTAWWGHPRLPGDLEGDETLGGDGTPQVAAFTPEPFAATLGVSTLTGMALLAEALDLVHRLPVTWARVQDLTVPAWKARRVARDTHTLTKETAAVVDRAVAPILATAGPARIDRVIAQTVAAAHPVHHQTREETAKQEWEVRLVHPPPGEFTGTSDLYVRGDTLTLTRIHDLITTTAARLATDGDTDPLGVRKVTALGLLTGSTGLETITEQPKTRLYLHLDLSDLTDLDEVTRVGRVERLGPATTRRIRDWVGSSQVTIHPVLRMDRQDAVDAHDPPMWMRELVTLRDPHCVFPHCQRTSRACDLDHIDPYDQPDDNEGPPGQTRPENLAPLCRRHHRGKTTRRWRYRRLPDGTYQWTAPGGTTYDVTT